MARLTWDNPADRVYENGIDRVVLYVDGSDAAVWSGVTEIVEQPIGAKAKPYYIDGVKYQNHAPVEEFGGLISAFYSPEAFDQCDGTSELSRGLMAHQQGRRPFGLSYRTQRDNAMEAEGYLLHIIYNAKARPTQRLRKTQSVATDLDPFSWAFSTKAVPFPELRPTSHIWFDSTKISSWLLAAIEEILYGTDTTEPRLPYPEEILDLLELLGGIIVIDYGDGTFSVEGPDEAVISLDEEGFQITWPTAVNRDSLSFSVSSA